MAVLLGFPVTILALDQHKFFVILFLPQTFASVFCVADPRRIKDQTIYLRLKHSAAFPAVQKNLARRL
jgi:hypothetical protein